MDKSTAVLSRDSYNINDEAKLLKHVTKNELNTQHNKGKEGENSYQKLKRSWWTGTRTCTRKQNRNILTNTAIFLNQKRANVCEHTKKMASLEFLKGATRGL